MSLQEVDPVLAPPKRLAALGILVNAKKVEFSFIRDHLQLSDSDLSKQMTALINSGYVRSNKTGKGRTRKTWFEATAQGRSALSRQIEVLNSLVSDVAKPEGSAGAE